MIRAVLLALVLAATGAAADTLGEQAGMTINPLNDTDFEVVQTRVTSAAGYFWCGAAGFVGRKRAWQELDPIYLRRGIGPSQTVPGRRAVVFSTSNAGLPPPDPDRLTLTISEPGAAVKVVDARRYCRDAFTRSTK